MTIKIKVNGLKVHIRDKMKNDYKMMLEDATKRVWIVGSEYDLKTGYEFISFTQL